MDKLTTGDRVMVFIIYILLAILAFVTFYPFWNSLAISFNVGRDTSLGGITFWPREFTLENYQIVFRDKRLVNAFFISVLRTVVGTAMSVFITAMLAYGLSKRKLLGRKYFMIFCLLTMFFSGGLIPTFILVKGLGLFNTFWAMIVPTLVLVWYMIIFRTFFQQLPQELEEAAQIDGASSWGIFFRIALPLSVPVIAAISLFTAIFHWNDWFLPMIYLTKEKLIPIQTLLQRILNANTATQTAANLDAGSAAHFQKMLSNVTGKSLSMAIMMVATIPIILVYPFVQKHFVKGVLIGSLKD